MSKFEIFLVPLFLGGGGGGGGRLGRLRQKAV
jgi:hypothetical protein